MKRPPRVIDLFCGAGGCTTGAIAAGCEVVYALNHWTTAIDSHQANYSDVKHRCAPIDRVPLDDAPDCDILIASPECTHHSNARGSRPIEEQRRATGWDVVRWVEHKRPRWFVVENLREFLKWGPVGKNGRPLKSKISQTFNAWRIALESLGYHVEWKLLNAASFGAATKRVRLFVIGRRGNSKRPIPFPSPTHHQEQWRPASSIIDWSIECPSIFTRRRPLVPKTLKRIQIGLEKFVAPFVVRMRNNMNGSSLEDPLGTITAGGGHHGLCIPFGLSYHGGKNPSPSKDGTQRQINLFDDPLPAIDTNPRYAVAAPLFSPYLLKVNHGDDKRTGDRVYDVNEPLRTVTSKRTEALCVPYMVDIHEGRRDASQSVHEPLKTIITKPGDSLCLPFLTEFYGTGKARSVNEPLSTLTAKPRHGLAMISLIRTMERLGIADIGFRMLQVDELARATGFPEGYYLHGSKADQIKQIGNAVPPVMIENICRALSAA